MHRGEGCPSELDTFSGTLELPSLSKEEKSKLFWKAKRKRQKEKKKEKKQAEGEKQHWTVGLSEEEIEAHKELLRRMDKWKALPLEEIEFAKPKVVIDLTFTEFMQNKELRSVISQLSFTYGFLRRATVPLELHICSFYGVIKEKLQQLQGFASWKVYKHEEAFHEIFQCSDMIYLSPDAPTSLIDLEDSRVYVIGGIVDHNRLKGLTHNRASTLEIESRSLPIQQYLGYLPSNSLNINHVFEILCKYKATGDWTASLQETIPKRKSFADTRPTK